MQNDSGRHLFPQLHLLYQINTLPFMSPSFMLDELMDIQIEFNTLLCRANIQYSQILSFTQLCIYLFNFRWRRERIFNKTLALEVESEIYNYAKSNLAIINIFIKEPYSKRFRKTEKMSRIAYIASSGGLLGLCMGFSFVSLAEILYHCFICVSIFFKKSSKSTHVMKDLYASRRNSHKN